MRKIDDLLRFRSEEEQTLWERVVIAVASSSNAADKTAMTRWADHAVQALRERTPLAGAFDSAQLPLPRLGNVDFDPNRDSE